MDVVEGANYWARNKGMTKYTFMKMRVAYIEGNNVALEYAIAGTKDRVIFRRMKMPISRRVTTFP